MSKQQLAAILEISAQNPPPPNANPEMMRAWFEAINEQTPIAEGAMVERLHFGLSGGDLIRFAGCNETDLIIYFHGGGFLFGSSRSHRVIASNLARASGVQVLAADYRMAPEHPSPTAHDDAYDVYKWALSQGYGSIALCGDSAGGNLALAVAVRARDEGLSLPVAISLMSPALDFACAGDSHHSVADAPLLTKELSELFINCYLGTGDRTSPTVTPFNADFRGLPPVLVHVGTWEILRDDSVTVVERLKAAGVKAEIKVFDGMVHSWQLFAPMLDEGMQSIEEAGGFIRDQMNSVAQASDFEAATQLG